MTHQIPHFVIATEIKSVGKLTAGTEIFQIAGIEVVPLLAPKGG